MNYRLYTFVAHHYLSPLQCGIQTAHVVSELANMQRVTSERQQKAFSEWAGLDKTIIVCGAGNHDGVIQCWAKMIMLTRELDLPVALFKEDERSMNGMATACGVIVPQKFWDTKFNKDTAQWENVETDGDRITYHRYDLGSAEGQFIDHIKQYRLV